MILRLGLALGSLHLAAQNAAAAAAPSTNDPLAPSQDAADTFDALVSNAFHIAWPVCISLFVFLLLTRRCWMRVRSDKPEPLHLPRPSRNGLLIILLAMIGSAALGFPRLSHSLWTDEQVALRNSIIGQFTHDPEIDGQAESLFRVYWEEAEWSHTLWYYKNPNPHFLLNIAARISNRIWHGATGRPDWEFSEFSLRIVPFLCGLLAIPAWFFCLHRFGFRRAAIGCAVLLAFHPWFIRSITEARGYPLALLFLPLWLTALSSSLQSDKWKHWSLFGAFQVLLLYSWPGMIALVITTNVCLFFAGRLLGLNRPRWALTNILCVMLLLLLTAPCFAQIKDYIGGEALSLPVGLVWFKDLATRFLFGIDWHDHFQYSQENPAYINLESSPLPMLVAMGTFAIAAILSFAQGVRTWWKKSPLPRIVLIASLASFLLIYIPAALSGIFLFQSYLLFLLPIVIAIAASGAVSLFESRPRANAALASIAVLFAICTGPVTAALRSNTLDPIREAALAVRGTSDPFADGQNRIITAYVGLSARAYDPLCWPIDAASSPPDDPWPGLTQLMKYADLLDCELHVHLAFPQVAERKHPDIVRMLHTDDLFEKTHTLLGTEPQYKREIYHYRGGMFDMFK